MHWLDIRTSEVNSDLGNIPDTSEHLINAHQPSHDKHQSLLENAGGVGPREESSEGL